MTAPRDARPTIHHGLRVSVPRWGWAFAMLTLLVTLPGPRAALGTVRAGSSPARAAELRVDVDERRRILLTATFADSPDSWITQIAARGLPPAHRAWPRAREKELIRGKFTMTGLVDRLEAVYTA